MKVGVIQISFPQVFSHLNCNTNCLNFVMCRFYAGFQVSTAVLINFSIPWDMASRNPYVTRRIGGMYHLHLQDRKSD
jgi:hypothetical protein